MYRIGKKYLQMPYVLLAIFFLIMQVAADLSLPTITSHIINKGIAQNNQPYIWHMGAIMLGIAFMGITGAVLNVYFAATQSQRLGMKLRHDLFHKITHMDVQNVDKFGDATLITRTTNDVTQLQNVFQTGLRMMLMSPIMLIGASIMVWNLDRNLTMVFAVALPLLAISVFVNMAIAMPRFKKMQGKVDKINLIFQQGLSGVRVIRAFNRDKFEIDKFAGANKDLTHTARVVFTTTAMMFPIMQFILSATNIGIVWFGATFIGKGMMPVGNLVAFLTYATQILMSFMQLSMVITVVPRAQASADRVNAVMDERDLVHDPENALELPNEKPSLVFDHVEYTFPNANRPVLKNLNFMVQSGQTLAIIGGTGAGKSTFMNLIPRLIDPTKGRILLNGVDIKQLTQHDLHAAIAITQQKAVLFSGTVRSNLQYGKHDATEEEMNAALVTAQSADFVAEQGGLDMTVEQNGGNFSGGQRQRLAIARTLIKQALVYVFDDSFSALDFATDANLRKAINTDPRLHDSIKVIVAQRIATVMNADLIIVLENGQITGMGTHDELAKTNEQYQEIMHSQLSDEDLKEVGLHA